MTYRFAYSVIPSSDGSSTKKPVMPVILTRNTFKVEHHALLDTGADANVLPYYLGVELGGHWEKHPVMSPLGGAFGRIETRGLLVHLNLANLAPVVLAFIWAKTDNIPLIFGQLNFFDAFNVCFFRADGYFEVTPRP